jgi:hypothetical protein
VLGTGVRFLILFWSCDSFLTLLSYSPDEWHWFVFLLRITIPYADYAIAQIISGFISFGTLHIHTKGFAPWQWLMIITGLLTFLTALAYW